MNKKRKCLGLGGIGFCIVLPVFLAVGSNIPSKAENVINSSTETAFTVLKESRKTQKAERMQEPSEPYQQILLYLRQGLYQHQIEGTYQAYFREPKEEVEGYFCEILLEGEGDLWRENISYIYNKETGWYTFNGQYDPILVGEALPKLSDNSDFVQDIKDNYIYTCQISGKMDLAYPMKYIAENGPVEDDARIEIPYNEVWRGASGAEKDRLSYGMYPRLYQYRNDRLNLNIAISYPEINLSDADKDAELQKLEESINEQIRAAFFYSYGIDNEDALNPRKELNGSIQRNYIVTRRDEKYLSMRIYESNNFRAANHPNKWETAITIDMQSGKALSLGDIVGKECTIGDLFGSGAFHCMWFWGNGEEEYLKQYKESTVKCSAYTGDFYLTDKSLGFITIEYQDYINIEADFKDLGLNGF